MKSSGVTRACVTMMALLLHASMALAAHWKPARPPEIVAMSGPGGANDVIARTLQRIIQQRKLVDAPLTVVSKVGAGGVIAWSYLNQHAGDGAYISVSPINLLIEHILGASPITYTDVTPCAPLLTGGAACAAKPAGAPPGGRDVADKLKADPRSVSFAVAASLGG